MRRQVTTLVVALAILGVGAGAAAPWAGAVTSQVIAAGTSATNLPTETTWPGAQNPPYICCWNQQGQYVTFSFTLANAGSTSLALRYSAGNGAAYRKLELDGSVLVAKQPFATTTNWSTWTTVTLTQTLTAGSHTLKVWFDSTAGSANWLNLDNLTVSQGGPPPPPPPPASVSVAVGYADSATGLSPWSGSANTFFIGEGPQCCATHGPNNGSPGYDSGAIEVTNTSSATVTVNAVRVDFGGGSTPSSFNLWGGGTSTTLPQSLAPGGHLVLTMTSGFNFDTSDLFGEACHLNTDVVPVVHVTVNGTQTDYQDDFQILNSDGADLASCPGDVSEQVPFTTIAPGAQPSQAPVETLAPALWGVPKQGHVMSGFPGAWDASPPPTLSLQWLRCDSTGANCAAIAGATSQTYLPIAADVGDTLRFQVTAKNASGTSAVASPAHSSVIASAPADTELGDTSTGFTSVFATSTPTEYRTIVTASASGTTTDFEFFARGAGATQSFTPKIYSVVNGAKGSLLATGSTVSVPKATDGRWYVSTLSGLHLIAGTQYDLALDSQGVFNGTYVGDETNGTMSFFVDYAPGA